MQKEEILKEEAVENVAEKTVQESQEINIEEVIEKAVERAVEKLEAKFIASAESVTTIKLNGAVTGETGREAPDKRVDFSKLSYSELCAFLENNPKARL